MYPNIQQNGFHILNRSTQILSKIILLVQKRYSTHYAKQRTITPPMGYFLVTSKYPQWGAVGYLQ